MSSPVFQNHSESHIYQKESQHSLGVVLAPKLGLVPATYIVYASGCFKTAHLPMLALPIGCCNLACSVTPPVPTLEVVGTSAWPCQVFHHPCLSFKLIVVDSLEWHVPYTVLAHVSANVCYVLTCLCLIHQLT